MSRAAGLCVLGLLCLHSGVLLGQDLEDKPEVLVLCDDSDVDAAAKAAVSSFNEGVVTGNKMALYQILSASKGENASGVMYSVKFTSRKSDCPAGSAKHWTDCDLAHDEKDPRPCNATVYVSEGLTNILSVECSVEEPVVAERVFCLGCPVDVDVQSDDLKVPLTVSISKYNGMSNASHLFMFNSLGYATRQVVAGLRYRLYFDMRKSNCSKDEYPILHPSCSHDTEDVHLANCNSTVDIAEWRHEVPEAHLECEHGPMQFQITPQTISRRRPAGWSPLRNVIDRVKVPTADGPSGSSEPDVAAPTAPTTAAAPPPANPEAKSSEEEDSTKVAEHPFHCPSKPWKIFVPAPPSATEAPTLEAEQDPTLEAEQGPVDDFMDDFVDIDRR